MKFVPSSRWQLLAGTFVAVVDLLAPTHGLRAQNSTPAATLTNITQFSSSVGTNPYAAPVQAADGSFYGTTRTGGANNYGAIYRRAADGTITVLHSFGNYDATADEPLDGSNPNTALIAGATAGTFYGTTPNGGANGSGTVYRVVTDGTAAGTTFSVLHTFVYDTDGGSPQASLLLALDGNLYGTATNGGPVGNGTIFSLSTDGATFAVLYNFDANAVGYDSQSPLIEGPAGTFYGTGYEGGPSGLGSLFKFTAANGAATTPVVLHAFNSYASGGYPEGNLVLDNGVIYGTTYYGGPRNYYGSIYAISTDGTTRVNTPLYGFTYANSNGYRPVSGLRLVGGVLYGITPQGGATGAGTVFSAAEDGSALTVLHQFASPDGTGSQAPLTVGIDGTTLYGTAPNGGASGDGTLFQLSLDGTTFNVLNNFSVDYQDPEAALVQGADGAFYGTTQSGGAFNDGTVFRVAADGTITTLHIFKGTQSAPATSDGANPVSSLIQGANGLFYGTTNQGGDNNNGTVFSISADGSAYTVLHSFAAYTQGGNIGNANPDGSNPTGALVVGQDGNLYGVANNGGTSGYGVVYRLALDGTGFALVQTFTGGQTNSAYPAEGLTLGPDGSFYGSTNGGGPFGNGDGTVYKLSADGATYTLLHAFTGANAEGRYAYGAPVFGADGFLYGTTRSGGNYSGGTVYKVSTDGTTFITLYNFAGNSDGSSPTSTLLADPDGYLYGTTQSGGNFSQGTIYRLSTAGDVSVLYSFSRSGGDSEDDSISVNSTQPTTNAVTAPPGAQDNANGGQANLILGADGNLYGTSPSGGTTGNGSVYQVTLSPLISSPAGVAATVNTAFSFQVTAFHSPTSFAATGLPAGLTIDPLTGMISGKPTATGTSTVTLTVANATGSATSTLVVVVEPPAVPAPVITSAGSANPVVGQAFSYQIKASNTPTSYGATGLPTGLTVNTTTGLISGTATTVGTYNATISAANATGPGTSALTLTVTTTSLTTPVISSPSNASAQVGQAFSYQITASNTPTSYGATGLPAGLTLNTTTGLISGTPTATGTFAVALSAANATGTGTSSLSLTVTAAPVVPPAITSATTADGQVAVAFSYQIVASNTPIFYGASGLPMGLSINDQTGVISGTPKASGTFAVTLSATNSGGSGIATLTLTIAPQPLPVISIIASVPSVTLGTNEQAEFAVTRTGGDATQPLVLNYTVSGNATSGVDYVVLKGTKTFKANKTTVRIKVTPEGKLGNAAKKTVKVTLQPGDGYTLGTATTARVHILTAP